MTCAICSQIIFPQRSPNQNYPNLIAAGTTVPTIANRALLVAYTWPENSPRYKKVAQIHRRVFRQDQSIQQPVEASQVARSQSFGRNAWLGAI